MILDVDITCRLGAFTVDAQFTGAGGVTALFGHSGAGKSSLVNMIGGLLRPDRGHITLDGRALFDSKHHIHLPPNRRRISYVFQDARLFPHLSVRNNLLYGRWFTPAGERWAQFAPIVELLGIGDLLQRRPSTLSGGEKQRVAIGRALLASPRLLLMDEPLASLDADRKAEILPYIERLRDELKLPIVYVSHALDEVIRLAGTLVLLESGRVVAAGPVADVMRRLDVRRLTGQDHPRTVIDTRIEDHDTRFGLTRLTFDGGVLQVPYLALPVGTAVRVAIRDRDIGLAVTRPQGVSLINILPGTVVDIADTADESEAHADVLVQIGRWQLVARISRLSAHDLDLAPGKPVFALFKAMALDAESLGRAPGPETMAAL
ncbi:MAG: molybdenum ABC transporter ATP-binding protein [Azospirillaceae bacterium]|nr:molybdenum ABC transporter ATP-binding protein [Azospirillaceae bacterium]